MDLSSPEKKSPDRRGFFEVPDMFVLAGNDHHFAGCMGNHLRRYASDEEPSEHLTFPVFSHDDHVSLQCLGFLNNNVRRVISAVHNDIDGDILPLCTLLRCVEKHLRIFQRSLAQEPHTQD